MSALEQFFTELANIERTVTSIAALPVPADHAPVYPPNVAPIASQLPYFINTFDGSNPNIEQLQRIDKESTIYHFVVLYAVAADRQPAALQAIVPHMGEIIAAFGRGRRNQFNRSVSAVTRVKELVGYFPYMDRLYTGAKFFLDVQIDEALSQ